MPAQKTSARETAGVTLADIKAAHRRIRPYVRRTAVDTSETLDRLVGAKLFFKLENQQKIGAFKARGAHNAVFSLAPAEARRGVVTHSSGNHAAALALAARNRGIAAYIVMPSNAPRPKVESVRRLGGQITFCEPTLAARESSAADVMARTGAVLVHPYNDERVIAGQGTAALELLDDEPRLDAIIAPVGGGGLLSGTALAAKGTKRTLRVYSAEPAAVDDARLSLKAGRIVPVGHADTIADGLRTSLGEKTFPIIARYVDDILTVDEAAIGSAMRLAWEVMKIVIEPSAAVPVAALLARRVPARHRRIGVILSGGNVDLAKLPWLVPPR